ncbi:MAG: hypothetical protein EBU23_11875, partial [Mycobacteriaceae bacterium]|nr:hypothetical protein [Mycobacteriaceae bacterium]
TGAHVVRGEILRAYLAAGGPTGEQTESGGGPTVSGGGWTSPFQNGTVSWVNKGNGVFGATVSAK